MTSWVSGAGRKAASRLGRVRGRTIASADHGTGWLAALRRSLDSLLLLHAVRAVRSRMWRPGVRRRVPVARILVGWDGGVPPTLASRRTGDIASWSEPVCDGPHAQLLRDVARCGQQILVAEELARHPYGRHAARCVDLAGDYFGARSAEEIAAVARSFVARSRGGEHEPLAGQSRRDAPIRVRRIRGSDAYQVFDGHHRLATAAVEGTSSVPVKVEWPPVRTPLQRHLLAMSWLAGRAELYQPVDRLDVARWPVVRQCSDRMAMIERFLDRLEVTATGASSLDVASCYGWFVRRFLDLGFDACGVELDPAARAVATQIFGIDPHRLAAGDAVGFLEAAESRYTVVTCFSLVHHFWLDRQSRSADDLLAALARRTGTVLFLDAGQGTERWFRRSLAGWTPASIQAWLEASGWFREVVPLGVDADDRPPFEGNYGRTLFACLR